ncbi:MAG TPA: ABC transporter permease [Geminicoccus sp.]|uniref:ABC transporter permease n=1 Tax=Geminicoccus sp. TaxID=2024832 RepID=UPI002E33E953|nr:ABC transporter permease [Geminicoccus sp.]HEX2528641.1 ABC transporter permease [Geminicoccus sp.]
MSAIAATPRVAEVRRLVTFAVPLVIVAGLLVVMYAFAPNFFRVNNLINILVQTSALGIMAIGMTFVMVGGGIDLSIPANMAFSAVIGALVMREAGVAPGILTMLLTGGLIGLFNGVAAAIFKMTPFVVTLATMTVVGGATVWITNSQSIADFPESFFDLMLARPGGVPLAILILLAVALAASIATTSTIFGRQLYAIGLNARAARVARVPVERVLLITYVVSGLLAGLAAAMLTARLGSASANLGNDGVVLDIVSACVVGGVSIYGGSGRPIGAVLGALFIILISNSLNQLGVSYFMNLVIKGVAIIGFIYLDRLTAGPGR